jgi:1-phosphofructokinase
VIITVTPNPSVDRTLFIDSLPRGTVIRSVRSRCEPSGKGVNVALALWANGYDVLAVLPIGGPAGAHMVEMLDASDVLHVAVPIAGAIRTNISLVEPDGTVTKINEPGPVMEAAEADNLIAAALERAGNDVTWLAGCGTLPGAGQDIYARLTAEGRRRGVRTAVDTSGAALHAVLAHRPDLVKPNADELAQASGRALTTLGDVVDAAEDLRRRGAGAVLASLGPDGAVLVDEQGALHGEAPIGAVVSAVGAGDAMLAGFLSAGGMGRRSLHTALTWAAAQVQHEGTLYSSSGSEVAVTVHDHLDRARVLIQPATHAGIAQPSTSAPAS